MPVVPGLWMLRDVFVNLYYAAAVPDQPRGPWVLTDTMPGSADKIQRHAVEVFGTTPPVAILLTHGHIRPRGRAAWPAQILT